MFNFIKNLFKKKETVVEKDYVIERVGCTITLSPRIHKELKNNGYTISVTRVNNKVATISVYKTIAGKSIYIGTVKKMFNVRSFKDGNCANFSESNLIYKGERK